MKIIYLFMALIMSNAILAERSEKEMELIKSSFSILEERLMDISDRDSSCMRYFIQGVFEKTVSWSIVERNNEVCGGDPLKAAVIGIFDVSLDKSIGVWSDLCDNHVDLETYLGDEKKLCPKNCWYESEGEEFLDQVPQEFSCPKTTKLFNGKTAILLEFYIPLRN
jgi:hypothetical protein